MPTLTPTFQMQYERRMRAITENEYTRLLSEMWWNKVAKSMTLEGSRERLTWLLNTAQIERIGPTGVGALTFEGMQTQTVDYLVGKHGKGIKVHRDQIEDLDGTGLNTLAEWSAQIGVQSAYYPQKMMAQLILNGANTDGSAAAYDGVPFFADNTGRTIGGNTVKGHPYNPFKTQLGGYTNWWKGSPSGAYPGALPIDDSVTVDVALKNLGIAIAAVSAIRMPNGEDPRMLKVAYMIAPPRMAPRVRQLHDAKVIAQAAATGGGGADVESVIRGWGLGTPIIAQELGAGTSYSYTTDYIASSGLSASAAESVSGSDTTYYLVCQEMTSTSLGGLLFLNRKPFKVNYYTGDAGGIGNSAELDRTDEFEYHCKGRMGAGYGHPYTVIRVDGS